MGNNVLRKEGACRIMLQALNREISLVSLIDLAHRRWPRNSPVCRFAVRGNHDERRGSHR